MFFFVADLYSDKHKNCNTFQVSMLFIQSNIDELNIHVTVKISTFANLRVQRERFIWEYIPEDEQQMLQDTLPDNDSHLTKPISGISAGKFILHFP